jgi:GT2 family glycosyltransferase
MSRVSIILLVKNGGRYLDEMLTAVFAQRVDFGFEVIAIDSGSRDSSKEILRRYAVQLFEIAPSEFNHGGTRNFGASLADPEAEYLVYLTQDATPADEHWLANLIRPMEEDRDVGGVFGRHVPRTGAAPALARQLLTVWQTGGSERLVKTLPGNRETYERDKLYYVFFSDTSSALRRSAWARVPFRLIDFAEDADWADRALQAGYRLVFEPASMVVHSHDYPVLEQFRQNVDHMAGMKRLFPGNVHQGWRNWLRLFAGIPKQVVADWRFTHTMAPYKHQSLGRRLFWMVHSPVWHLASALGTLVGTEIHRLPAALRRSLSRQERLRSHTSPLV